MDVGGKNCHRLSPIYYTSIAEIKGFRFKLKKTFLHQKEITKRMIDQVPGRPAPIHSALLGGTIHRIVLALPCPKLDFNKPGSKRHKRWNLTQRPFYRNPFSWGLVPASRL